ncbi:TetR/AcrR family transcriptional regulator [Paenibacillus polysaccharolyticus]|uniref:TetR/AcrR family transcriptional regulator n=1 Tax=Paenibacillus cucumis (ex Kampfer et al. 2016) TaxID=1776858 RepID=A0ABS7KNV8_9BACL|nr:MULTISPECIES: TetR/AcrR family transcriptional regulator [Paenibacillus]MBY0205815.1 TetR/AcrR family transcriptional regulator [Paenibacillus cucumis (ex Kampfer et al. 2016)]MCM3133374.1 TetR/AcrR family transcriptional regulator [Paenibacillus polysaccharolyticus]MCP1132484.1 TetR/AcrR family transcriptional regulator [Paenibacillus polysaccharolyticus]MDP9699222.1 AcrR family transcriptional regulator [Paenibacillus intestini]
MSKKRIKEIAIQHFNRFGYEGTKMAQIAEEAGIRKQSLAYHYSSKKDLLLEVYEEVVQEEQQFVQDFLGISTAGDTLEQRLYAFLLEHKNRFLTQPNVAFMYILSFMAPLEVNDFVLAQYRTYLGTLKKEVTALFASHEGIRLSPEEATLAFVTLMDGLDIQLVYETRQSYEQAMAITWNVFWSGIQS